MLYIAFLADVNTRTSKSFDGDHKIGGSHSLKSHLLAIQIRKVYFLPSMLYIVIYLVC